MTPSSPLSANLSHATIARSPRQRGIGPRGGIELMTATRRSEARHEAAEQDAIRRTVARMLEQFPELPATEIERSVTGSYDTLDDSAVRDFIPVLERATRRHLAEHSYRRYRA
jgi:hypothetical protein